MAHAKLGASSCEKWSTCVAAPSMEAAFAPKEEDIKTYTDEGTACHYVGEQVLRGHLAENGAQASDFLGKDIPVHDDDQEPRFVTCNAEMVESAEVYVNYVLAHGGTLFVEERVDYSAFVPQGFGTADALTEVYEMCKDKLGKRRKVNTLYVDDLKYGKGIMVSAYENKQGKCYALGSIESLDMLLERSIERIVIAIIQPRKDHISEFEIWVDDLLEWAETELKPRGELAWKLLQASDKALSLVSDDGFVNLSHLKPEHFHPSEKGCQWCKIKTRCKAKAKQGYAIAVDGFEDLTAEAKKDILGTVVTKETLRDVNIISNEELAKIYEDWKLFTAWGKTLQETLLSRLMEGQDIPGYKPVLGNGKRAWSLEGEEIVSALRTAGLQKRHYEKVSVVSPTEAEKLLKEVKPKDHKKRYTKLAEAAVCVTEGNPTVAQEHDKRDSLVVANMNTEPEAVEDDDLGLGSDDDWHSGTLDSLLN